MGKGKAAEFDEIAQTVFLPMYSVIAEQILQRTGVFEGRMVDIGCGGGHLGLNVLRRSELSGTFVDISSEAVEICQDRAEEWGLSKRVRALAGDVHALPLENESAELIVSRSSYGFWDDYDKAFTEIYRVLAPGGKTYIGGGLGNRETKKQVTKDMAQVMPGWPQCVLKNQRNWETGQFTELFERRGFAAKVVENEDEGRWFILSKPTKASAKKKA